MPTYEYACTSCGEHLEVAQSFTDEPLDTCPHCGGPLRKVFGAIGIVLKGSGFYRNDSRAGAGSSKNGSSPAPEPAGSSESSSSGDSSSTSGGSTDKGGAASSGDSSSSGSSSSSSSTSTTSPSAASG